MADNLIDAWITYDESSKTNENYTTFKRTCSRTIKASRETLEKYDGIKQVLLNIGLAILGLGIGFLIAASIKKALTGTFFFKYTNDTTNTLNLDVIEQQLPQIAVKS